MDLLDKLKRIFNDDNEIKEKAITEIIKIEDLPFRLENKINELSKLKIQFKEVLIKRVSKFEIDIKEKIKLLENIDISERKEYVNVKFIVEENLLLYISYLKRTIDKIKDIENKYTEEYISSLFQILNEFKLISSTPFEKATILIGEELGSTREIIKSFIQKINKAVEDNNFIFEKSKICNTISNLLSESRQLTYLHTEIENKLLEMNVVLENASKEQDILKHKLIEIKEGTDFKRDNERKTEYLNKLNSLERDLQIMKGKLNLKDLLKKFHHDKNIDYLVRNYLNDFKSALKEDKDLRIFYILQDKNEKSFSQLKEIQNNLLSLCPLESTKTEKEISIFEEKIRETCANTLNLEESLKDEIKRKEKLSLKIEKINSYLIEHAKLLFSA